MILPKRLLLPLKGEEVDSELLNLACSMARQPGGKIYALYIVEVPRQYPVDADLAPEAAKGEQVLNRVEGFIKSQKCEVVAELLQARNPATAIVKETVDRQIDLVMLALPYKQQYGSFSMGRVIPYVLQTCPCPVLVLREALPSSRSPVSLPQGARRTSS